MADSHNSAPPILLAIAGFDPCSGAGVSADLKTFAAHNTLRRRGGHSDHDSIHPGRFGSPHHAGANTLRAQLEALAGDLQIAAVKIGMLGGRGQCRSRRRFSDSAPAASRRPRSGNQAYRGSAELLDSAGVKYLRDELAHRPVVLTPNIAEAEILTGMSIAKVAAMKEAAGKSWWSWARKR